jgi:hypothetical protein
MVAKWSKLPSGYFLGVGAMEVEIKSYPFAESFAESSIGDHPSYIRCVI